MKSIITTIVTAACMFFGVNAHAANPVRDLEAKDVLHHYVEAVTLGSDNYYTYLLADDFEYINTANERKSNKKSYLQFLKENKGYSYNAKTTYTILDQSGKSCLAKSTMEFEKFTRVDHITMHNTKDGWKVSRIVTTYL